MDVAYIAIGFILLLIGFSGCIVPGLPGPPFSFIAVVVLVAGGAQVEPLWLITFGIAVVVITVLDYVLPGITVQKFDGTKSGFWGATIGLFCGLIFPVPGGFLMGTFLGAFIGECTTGRKPEECLKPALGSLLGVFLGTAGKMLLSAAISIYFIYLCF
jgi:uncharacterized protein